MIHLPLKYNEAIPGILSADGALRQIEQACEKGNGDLCTTYYYRHLTVISKLRAYSLHKSEYDKEDNPKCSYCESYSEATAPLQVEHYRPKKGINPKDTAGYEHPGYYWLGLEWTNLLLSCPTCNGKGAKGIRFPIRGSRAAPAYPVELSEGAKVLNRQFCNAADAPLVDENPLLLNPEIDHPEDYLTFDVNGNIIAHGHDLPRGRSTIKICKLNRPLLKKRRIHIWDESRKRLLLWVYKFQLNVYSPEILSNLFEDECTSIIQRAIPQMDHCLWGRYLNDHIEEFVQELKDETCIQLFLKAYHRVVEQQSGASAASAGDEQHVAIAE